MPTPPFLSTVGGGVGRLMANAILNFHFDFPHPSLIGNPIGDVGSGVNLKARRLVSLQTRKLSFTACSQSLEARAVLVAICSIFSFSESFGDCVLIQT